jgi:hypothetical protein
MFTPGKVTTGKKYNSNRKLLDIEMGVKEVGCEDLAKIRLGQDRLP